MNNTFIERSTITIDPYKLTMEEEVVDVPDDYDEGGEPPSLRLAIHHEGQVIVCNTLGELASAFDQVDVAFSAFCSVCPSDVATMITAIEQMPRPIQNNALFRSLESGGGFKLDEIQPRVQDGYLVWHELLPGSVSDTRRRRLSTSTLTFIEEEMM